MVVVYSLVAGVLVISAVVFAIRSWYRRRLESIQRRAMCKVTAILLHQIKNPLQTVLLHAEVLADQAMDSDSESSQDICAAIIGASILVGSSHIQCTIIAPVM